MELNSQVVIKALRDAEHSAATSNWYQVQQGCRQILEAIAKDPEYTGVIQYERDENIGGYRIRLHHGAVREGYHTWAFHFRWASDVAEFAAFLQELGYEWDKQTDYHNDGEEALGIALLAEERNDEIQLAKAEWLEREQY